MGIGGKWGNEDWDLGDMEIGALGGHRDWGIGGQGGYGHWGRDMGIRALGVIGDRIWGFGDLGIWGFRDMGSWGGVSMTPCRVPPPPPSPTDRGDLQEGRAPLHVDRAPGLHPDLPLQPGHGAARRRPRAPAQTQPAPQIRGGAQAPPPPEARHRSGWGARGIWGWGRGIKGKGAWGAWMRGIGAGGKGFGYGDKGVSGGWGYEGVRAWGAGVWGCRDTRGYRDVGMREQGRGDLGTWGTWAQG